jgi:hypothetical protein
MYWAPFFHIYQPPGQMPDILERVVNESYRKLIKELKAHPRAKITLNINGSLTEQLYSFGYSDVLEGIRALAEHGQIEFTESAKYHSFLPLTPWQEIVRQIKTNHDINSAQFGTVYKPVGFFPPEMAYNRNVAEVLASLGYQWIILDEIAYSGKIETCPYNAVYTVQGLPGLKVFFRERHVSNLIMSAVVRSAKTLRQAMGDETGEERYLLTGMDGETFGHHRPGLEKTLFEIFDSHAFQFIFISEIQNIFPLRGEIEPVASTWSSTEEDIKQGHQFMSWNDPENQIHAWQWELVNFTLSLLEKADPTLPSFTLLREKMDRALSSDHMWWASAKPWWSLEMIESGAWRLLDIIRSIPSLPPSDLKRGEELYQRIVLQAFAWQRTGYVRELAKKIQIQVKIPFKKRTLLNNDPGVYYAFLDMMRKQIKKAVKAEEFEKAILWRDAITKIENQDDIYDAVHAVDLLRGEVGGEELECLIKEYKEEYKKIRGGQPEQRG